MKTTDLIEQFTQRASEVGAVVYRGEPARSQIAQLKRGESKVWVSRAAAVRAGFGEASSIDFLEDLLDAGNNDPLVGVIAGRAALAETGSVLFVHDDQPEVWLTGVSDKLVVVLEERSVVESLSEASKMLAELSLAGQIWTLLTGPSRTADIERILTIGVHGCIEMDVILL